MLQLNIINVPQVTMNLSIIIASHKNDWDYWFTHSILKILIKILFQ